MDRLESNPLQPHAIIAGYGVPGRAVAEWMEAHGIPYTVIEQNEPIVERCAGIGVPIVAGDVRDEQVLKKAGIERATIVAIAIPNEPVVLEAVRVVRQLNPGVRIIARCNYISGGMEAARRGADETIVAEEIAAREFVRLLDGGHATIHSSGGEKKL